MLIDWFTIAAQIVNFLVLVALMKRFLYGPLVKAIDDREHGIAARLAESEAKTRAAAASVAEVEARRADLEELGARIVTAAREDAERQRGEMLQKARASVREMETKWRGEVERDRSVFLDEMRARGAAEVLATTRRALAGLAEAELEQSAIRVFLGRLHTIDPAVLRLLCSSEISVATPEVLSVEMQGRIRQAIEERLGEPARITFERAPSMAWGIELRGGGQRIGWTPDSYLDEMAANLNDALDRGAAASCPVAA